MAILEQIRHQVAIAGRVIDASTRQSVWHARVEVTAAPAAFTGRIDQRRKLSGTSCDKLPQRPDRVETARDGHFHFLDLPDGQYTLTASLPAAGSRYGTAQATATVARDAQGNLPMVTADLALPPTTLKGKVTATSGPVVMASVRVKGSGEAAFTANDGTFLLVGLEKGKRTIVVAAQGLKDASQEVLIANAGDTQTQDFALIAAP
jgi:hypothetical protein